MKNLIQIIFVLFISFIFATSATAKQPYKRIQPPQPTQTVDKIEVVEVFLYTCSHCYEFEPYLEKWLENKPEDVEFRRMPAVFSKTQIPYAHAFFTAEKLGVLDKIHKPLLEAIHEKKQSFDEKSLKAFFMKKGVDNDIFTQTYHSNETETKVKQALLMGKRYGVPGVPSVVINGRYLTSGSLAGSYPNVLAVIDSLIERERTKQ